MTAESEENKKIDNADYLLNAFRDADRFRFMERNRLFVNLRSDHQIELTSLNGAISHGVGSTLTEAVDAAMRSMKMSGG